jgi:hypothetical protein
MLNRTQAERKTNDSRSSRSPSVNRFEFVARHMTSAVVILAPPEAPTPGIRRQLLAAKKYQFVTRSGSDPKFWVSNTRSPRMNVEFFNRYKLQVDRTDLNSDLRPTKGPQDS